MSTPPRQVFVLTTGRTGSVTFSSACGHMTNFTSDHESLAHEVGDARFAYKEHHIEVDNRLSWHLGGLAKRFPDAYFVHLKRDPAAVAQSYLKRWQEPRTPMGVVRHQARLLRPWRSLVAVFGNGIIQRYDRWPDDEKLAVSAFLVETIDDNIEEFLRGKEHMVMRLETITEDFPRFWDWCGAEGDLDAAMQVWATPQNDSANLRLRQW